MAVLVIVAFAHNLFHEFGHWVVGTVLKNDMAMSLNGTWPKGGEYLQEWHSIAVGIAGPVFSILMATSGEILGQDLECGELRRAGPMDYTDLVFVEKYKTIYCFPLLFFPFFSRLFAWTFGNFSVQDEAGVSRSLGLGEYAVAAVVFSILALIVWRGTRKLRLDFGVIGGCFLGSVAGKLLVIGTNKVFFS